MRDLQHSLPMELMKAREAAMTRFRPMLREHSLTEQQWRVIRVLAEFGPLDASELAERSFLLAPSLTRILRHAEKKRLVKRLPDSSDQRRSILTLTAKGKQVFQTVAPDSEALYASIEVDFGTNKLMTLYDLLSSFYKTLNENDDNGKAV